jgi:hypothetical protein
MNHAAAGRLALASNMHSRRTGRSSPSVIYDFETYNGTLNTTGGPEALSVKQNFSALKIGLNYRFGSR